MISMYVALRARHVVSAKSRESGAKSPCGRRTSGRRALGYVRFEKGGWYPIREKTGTRIMGGISARRGLIARWRPVSNWPGRRQADAESLREPRGRHHADENRKR